MGCVNASEKQCHSEIERHLNIDGKASRHVRKILLLGSGDSGKDAFLKQLDKIYNNYVVDEHELEVYRYTIRRNVVNAMLTLLRKSQEIFELDPEKYGRLQIDMENEQITDALQLVISFGSETFKDSQSCSDLPPSDKMKDLGTYIPPKIYTVK